jgi:ATPase subunit of ABC transporter with duplicated ATPase domains
LDGTGNVEHYHGDYTEYHDWKAARSNDKSEPFAADVSEPRPSGKASSSKAQVQRRKATGSEKRRKATPPSSADGPKRVKIIKKPRDPERIEAEISALEKRLVELSAEMTKPEVSRDITKLVQLNDEYQQGETRLAELLEEWERAEASASSAKR